MIGLKVNMAKNCQECPCLKYGEWGAFEKSSCAINHKIVISNKKRPIECPLVELKGDGTYGVSEEFWILGLKTIEGENNG